MISHHAMSSFPCRHNTGPESNCPVPDHDKTTPIFLDNVFDLANTLVEISILCGVHESKAKCSVQTIVYFFIHYDQVSVRCEPSPKKLIRKEELIRQLSRKCLMNRVETHMAYTVIKHGFKAFYYESNEKESMEPGAKTSFPEKWPYIEAAGKTAAVFVRVNGLGCGEQNNYENKIAMVYRRFYYRLRERIKTLDEDGPCCSSTRGKAKPKPQKKFDKCKCPRCRRVWKRKLPVKKPCKAPLYPCTCGQEKFALKYVNSIWERPDMNLYYNETILGDHKPGIVDWCSNWMNPNFLNVIADPDPPNQAYCACKDWDDPWYLKSLQYRK